MCTAVLFALFTFMGLVTLIRIPFIENATLIPVSTSNNTLVNNQTCDQCLCTAVCAYPALNCFPNNTCQFFSTVPRTYSVQTMSQARLYFTQQILPNVSSCCMPDLNLVLDKLRNATPIYINVSPRCLAFDNHGYVVTSELTTGPYLYRFDATNLNRISQTVIPASAALLNMAFYNDVYYVGMSTHTIVMIDSNSLTVINNITSSNINGPRDIMVLNSGRTMVVASSTNGKLIFLSQ